MTNETIQKLLEKAEASGVSRERRGYGPRNTLISMEEFELLKEDGGEIIGQERKIAQNLYCCRISYDGYGFIAVSEEGVCLN